MKIYADTSFLVSLLYPGDTAHGPARAVFLHHGGATDWVTTEWTWFEVLNSLRQLCLGAGNTPAQAEALRRLFKNWHAKGSFTLEKTATDEAIQDAATMSAALGCAQRMRSADVLHIALLEQLNPDLFVTRDKEQHALAVARAFKSQLVP